MHSSASTKVSTTNLGVARWHRGCTATWGGTIASQGSHGRARGDGKAQHRWHKRRWHRAGTERVAWVSQCWWRWHGRGRASSGGKRMVGCWVAVIGRGSTEDAAVNDDDGGAVTCTNCLRGEVSTCRRGWRRWNGSGVISIIDGGRWRMRHGYTVVGGCRSPVNRMCSTVDTKVDGPSEDEDTGGDLRGNDGVVNGGLLVVMGRWLGATD